MTATRLGERLGTRRLLLFCGKGGVGKTTLAAASALAEARRASPRERPSLLLGTDPAAALARVLDVSLEGGRPIAPGLEARQIDPRRLLERFRERYVPRLASILSGGTYLADEDALALASASLPGMDELLAVLELSEALERHPRVFVDTAPSLHAQRLLALPESFETTLALLRLMREKARAVEAALIGDSASSDADRFLDDLERRITGLRELLRDGACSGLILVAHPDLPSAQEAARLAAGLTEMGLSVLAIIINAWEGREACCARGAARARAAEAAQADLERRFPDTPLYLLRRWEVEPVGLVALASLGDELLAAPPARLRSPVEHGHLVSPSPAKRSAGTPALPGPLQRARLILVGGKGGVGKSTVSATLALMRSRAQSPGEVLLASVGPPGGLSRILGMELVDRPTPLEGFAHLSALEVDAVARFERLKAAFRADIEQALERLLGGSALDPVYDREILRRLLDLAPPGVDEVAALAFLLDQDRGPGVLVLDTAPTGHLLRFLQMPATVRAWLSLVLRLLGRYPELALGDAVERTVRLLQQVRRAAQRLADPETTALVAVSLAGRIPSEEVASLRLQSSELGVPPSLFVVNRVTPRSACSGCEERRRTQFDHLRHLTAGLAPEPVAVLEEAWDEPRGAEALLALRWATWDEGREP